MSYILQIFFPVIIAMSISFIMIPKVVLISKKKNIYDIINNRKSHSSPTSRLGGATFLPSILIAITSTIVANYLILKPIICDEIELIECSSIMFGLVMLYIIGLLDDFIGTTYKTKFFFQILAAMGLIVVGFKVSSLNGILGIEELPNAIAAILTLIAIVGINNSYNLIDGIDGLCAGIIAITMAILIYWFAINGLEIYTIIASSLLGTTLMFLRYNLSNGKFKILMGDTGSLVAGFIICSLLLKVITHYQSMPTESDSYVENYLIIVLSIIFTPFIDTLRVFIGRLLKGTNPFKPDRTHLHHLIIDRGVSHKTATTLILLSTIVIIAITILLSTRISATPLLLSLLVYGSIITYSTLGILSKTRGKSALDKRE